MKLFCHKLTSEMVLLPSLMLMSLVIPSLAMMLGASTFALGLAGVLLFYIVFAISLSPPKIIVEFKAVFRFVCYFLIVIFFQGLINLYLHFEDFNFNRFLLSLFYLAFFIYGSFSFYLVVKKTRILKSRLTLYIIFYSFILMAFLSFAGFYPLQSAGKPIFFYTEPSHYALNFIPLLLCVVVLSDRKSKFIYLMVAFEIGLISQNLTLMFGVMLITLALFNVRDIVFLTCSCAILFSLDPFVYNFLLSVNPTSSFVSNHQDILSYILARAPINSAAINSAAINSAAINSAAINSAAINSAAINWLPIKTSNGSLLVFLSGWERAYLNFVDYFGFGVGFQQLGFVGRLGSYGQILSNIYNPQLGLLDGGSVGSKLVSEFGFFGFFGLIIYLSILIKTIKKIRLANNSDKPKSDIESIFFYSVYVTYIVDIFLRGTGYFSSSSFLFVAALFWIFRESHSHVLDAVKITQLKHR